MPRIRSLKPEHRQHRNVGPLTDRQYRLWVSMINEADDAGRLVCDPAQLRVVTWAYHPKVTVAHVEEAIQVLAERGRVVLYAVADVRYAAFPKWHDHQHPKKPMASVLPSPQDAGIIQHGNLGGTRGELEGNQFPTKPPVVEGKGSKGSKGVLKGREGSLNGSHGEEPAKAGSSYEQALAQVKLEQPGLAQAEAERVALQRVFDATKAKA